MKKIRIGFCDWWDGFDCNHNFIIDALSRNFDVTIDNINPQYLFCSCMGYEHHRFGNKCIKIFYSGENVSADFNTYDYAITSDYLEFGDRHFRYPQYFMHVPNLNRKPISDADALNRKFCNFVYSNSLDSNNARKDFFHILSKYKKVDSGGRMLNNIGGPVKDKQEFIAKYKFTIAFENSIKEGYTTEKLLEPLLANTVPIYYGSPRAIEEFNPKGIIFADRFESLQQLADEVKRIDNDDEAYLGMLNQPIFAVDNYPDIMKQKLEDFLSAIVNQPLDKARRRTLNGYTKHRIRDIYFLYFCSHCAPLNFIKRILFHFYRHKEQRNRII